MMRLSAPLLALLAMAGVAHADEARDVPAVGSKLTYRSVTTTTIPRATLTTGEEFTYIVTAADATSAEGIIKPRARIVQCKEDDTDLYCKSAAARPGAHFDGGLLTIPIASDIGDTLANESAFKYAISSSKTGSSRCPACATRCIPTPAISSPSQPIS
jgi:hypothetical protein